jgi:hypothetical protein
MYNKETVTDSIVFLKNFDGKTLMENWKMPLFQRCSLLTSDEMRRLMELTELGSIEEYQKILDKMIQDRQIVLNGMDSSPISNPLDTTISVTLPTDEKEIFKIIEDICKPLNIGISCYSNSDDRKVVIGYKENIPTVIFEQLVENLDKYIQPLMAYELVEINA